VPGELSSHGVPLPPDLRAGPVIVGVEAAQTAGRQLRAAVFLARSLDRPLLVVHIRRRVMPVAEGYLPVGDDLQMSPEIEKALNDDLAKGLHNSGDLAGIDWQLFCGYGEAAVELVRIADDKDAACVVVGKRTSGVSELLHRITSGSVSRAVVAAHKFPVLVVP